MQKAKLTDFTLAFDECGSGVPLLFIHGYPLSRRLWGSQLTNLSDTFRVLTPDLRGHGDSESGDKPHSMEQLAQDCFDFTSALGIRNPFRVCGLSMGGYIVMGMLRLHPERLAAVILTATRSAADTPEARTNRQKTTRLVQEHGTSPIISSMLPRLLSPQTTDNRPDLVNQVHDIMVSIKASTVIKDLKGLMTRPDSTSYLAALSKPVLIIHGADDQIVPLAEAQSLQQTIPNAQLAVLPDAGHLPNLEQPELFNIAVRNFLKGIPDE
jgi:3-oxoadipate enol-lactonase